MSFEGYLAEIALIAVLCGVIPFACLAVWCTFGVMIAGALADERRRRIFQLSLAGLLAASVVFLFI